MEVLGTKVLHLSQNMCTITVDFTTLTEISSRKPHLFNNVQTSHINMREQKLNICNGLTDTISMQHLIPPSQL
jgi:hypothetical protein